MTEHEENIADLQLDEAASSWIDTFSALDSKVYRFGCGILAFYIRRNHSQLHYPTCTLQSFLNTFLEKDVRCDGRMFSQCRSTTITSGVVTRNAAGSALVCIGSTQILAAVSLQVGTPAAGFMESGDLVVTSPQHSTWLERVLRESGLVDLNALSIISGNAAWRLQVMVMILNDDGNTRDAMLLASVAALRNTTLPDTVVDKSGVVCMVESERGSGGGDDAKTPLCALSKDIPIPLTVGFITTSDSENTLLLVDPSVLEEKLCESTCCMLVNSSTQDVVNCELSGSIAITSQQLALVAQMAQGRAQELTSLLE